MIEIDLSFVTAVITVKDNILPLGAYISASARAYQLSRLLDSDRHLLVHVSHILPYLGIVPISCYEYVCEWMESTTSGPQSAPDAHTPEYHRVLRDAHQHSSVAEQTAS